MADLDGKTIIVTGGAGFIGSNLVERLSRSNTVYAIDIMHTGSAKNLADAIKSGNVRLLKKDANTVHKLPFRAEYVFHLGFPSASPMYRKDPMEVVHGISGMISVLEYARRNDAKVVYASTSSIYNGIKPPHREDIIPLVTDYYTETRIAAERMAELYSKLYGIDSAGMRFFSVYGPHERAKGGYANLITQFLWDMQRGRRPLIYGDGEQRRDFVYVADVVSALTKATRVRGHGVFNVGTGKNYSLNELVELLNEKLGTRIKPRYKKITISNYVMETLADSRKARSLLGFKAEYSLPMGLDKVIEYYSVGGRA